MVPVYLIIYFSHHTSDDVNWKTFRERCEVICCFWSHDFLQILGFVYSINCKVHVPNGKSLSIYKQQYLNKLSQMRMLK